MEKKKKNCVDDRICLVPTTNRTVEKVNHIGRPVKNRKLYLRMSLVTLIVVPFESRDKICAL